MDVDTSVKAQSTAELWKSDKLKHKVELHWRITTPIATLVIAMLALPLSHTTPRSGRYAKLPLAILLYLGYSNLLGVGKTWIVQTKVPLFIGTWWVHVLALVLLFVLLKRSGHVFVSRKPASVSTAQGDSA